jgi:uncharacterized FlaG/YvyC family protein
MRCCVVLLADIAVEVQDITDNTPASTSLQQQQQHPELLQGVQGPSLKLLLQLLQHVLYYAVNGRIAELYRHGAPAAAAAAGAGAGGSAAARAGSAMVPAGHMGGASDTMGGTGGPASQLASALLVLREAFVGLFPVGRQFSAAETAELKQQVAGHLERARQQQQQEGDAQSDEGAADAQAAAAAAAAAVGDISRLLQLVQRWLHPQPLAAVRGAATDVDDEDDGEQADSGSSDGDEEEADNQKQQRRRAAPAAAVTQEQLQQAVTELGQDSGFSIAGLATLEQQLQARFGVQQFSQMGLGAKSLLQLLQQQPQLLALMQGGSGAAGAAAAVDVAACDVLAPVPLAAVMHVAGQAKACCGDVEEQGEETCHNQAAAYY